MKLLFLFYSLIILVANCSAQKDVKSIDSLVTLIEGNSNLALHRICDTTNASHDTVVVANCHIWYYNNKNLFKAVSLATRTDWSDYQFLKADTIALHVFYFYKDTLIKTVDKHLSNSIKLVDEYYFTKPNLTTEGDATEYSKRTKFQLEFAAALLRDFKTFIER